MLKIFIPAYNEEKALESNIKQIHSIISNKFKDFELYLVDDGSTDKTLEIAKNLKLANYKYIRKEGPTRRENLAETMAEYSEDNDIIGFMDADRSTGEEALNLAVNSIEKASYDIVIGSRYVENAKINRKFDRLIISKLFNSFVRFYFNSRIKDHECGFKFFKANILKELVKEMGRNYERKMFWDSELLVRAQRKNLKILEVPVLWNEGPKSALSFRKELPMVKYMLKLRFRL